jgi:hypothetical protein
MDAGITEWMGLEHWHVILFIYLFKYRVAASVAGITV